MPEYGKQIVFGGLRDLNVRTRSGAVGRVVHEWMDSQHNHVVDLFIGDQLLARGMKASEVTVDHLTPCGWPGVFFGVSAASEAALTKSGVKVSG